MIQEELRPILENIRQKVFDLGVDNLTIELIREAENIDADIFNKYIHSDKDFIDQVLELELTKFAEIFTENNFVGMNAIDAFLVVSRELAKKFYKISPIVTHEVKDLYPDIYEHHLQGRIDLVSQKVKDNLECGMGQNMYRNDISSELIARLYISRVIDIHNPIYFPPETYSFNMLFQQMVDSFIRSVATQEGLAYFEKQKKSFAASLL